METKFLVMDVDGTLTDGKIYMGNQGEVVKAFNIKDGYGIKNILPLLNIIPVIITARSSEILKRRCEELSINEVYQNATEKLAVLNKILEKYSVNSQEKYSLRNVAYIGDDIPDLNCMKMIKESGGIVACPADSVREVIEIADYVSQFDGGNGAVRDFCEYLKSKTK